jgi:hypothetical protein
VDVEPAIWIVHPNADPAEVDDLISRLANELGTPIPLAGNMVALPPDHGRVVAALDIVEPDWRNKSLISPP